MAITLELFELKTLCMDMAELGVANYIRTQAPAKDLISQREAYRLFQESNLRGWGLQRDQSSCIPGVSCLHSTSQRDLISLSINK